MIKTIEAVGVYEQLATRAGAVIVRFRDDLEVWDKEAIAKHPGCPFLHFTSPSNTHIAFLIPATEYPGKGEYVPFMFGEADREHLLNSVGTFTRHYAKPHNATCDLILYYDGVKLREIDLRKATEIVQDYQRRIHREWDMQRAK